MASLLLAGVIAEMKANTAVAKAAADTGLAQFPLDDREVEARCRDLVYEGTIAL
jgi:hypothetical protein